MSCWHNIVLWAVGKIGRNSRRCSHGSTQMEDIRLIANTVGNTRGKHVCDIHGVSGIGRRRIVHIALKLFPFNGRTHISILIVRIVVEPILQGNSWICPSNGLPFTSIKSFNHK